MQLQVVYAEALDSPRLSQKKALNSTQDKEVSVVWFQRLCLCQRKLILPQRIWMRTGYGWSQVALAVYIKVIFTLLVGLRVQDDWLESGKTNLCRTCHCLKVFLGVLGGSCGGNWTSCIGMKSLVWGSLYAHLNCRFWLIVYFCESKVLLLWSLVTPEQLSFSKRAGWPVGFGAIRIVKGRLEVSQLITNHYYLERKRMLSVNRRSSVRSRARSRAGRKLRLRKSVLNDCTQSRGGTRPIWCALT